jgi:hypothetical protein
MIGTATSPTLIRISCHGDPNALPDTRTLPLTDGGTALSRAKDKRQRDRARRQRKEQRRALSAESTATCATCGPSVPLTSARSAADPIYGVASPTIDPSLCWYIARTKPRMGDLALEALQAAKVVTYQPRTSEVVVRRGRRVVRRTPMLLRTVFIGVTASTWMRRKKLTASRSSSATRSLTPARRGTSLARC